MVYWTRAKRATWCVAVIGLLTMALAATALTAAEPIPMLTPEESALVGHIAARDREALALLERAVNVNSGTLNLDGVREVGAMFRPELDRLSFTTRWVDGAPFERAGHLIGVRPAVPGAGTPLRFLLIGHLDTVFEPDSPFQKYEALPGGQQARGPGVSDMKGGVVVMLEVLRGLQAIGALDAMEVTVVLHGDEERSGSPLALARADLIAAGKRADVAIGFEDGDGRFETAVVSRRGSTDWILRVTARAAHSSQIFREEFGAGAVFELARILDRFRRELAGEELLTFNPALVGGGTAVEEDLEQARVSAFGKTNVIAAQAVANGDLRTISPEQLDRARSRMREIVAEPLTQAQAEIVFSDGYPPMARTAGNLKLLAVFDGASRDLGFGGVAAVDPRQAGAADISFIAGDVGMAIDGLGLMGTGGHTELETAALETLSKQAQRVALTMLRLVRDGSQSAGESR